MIIDCFPFNNEVDLLEVRLYELAPVVDQFVMVESVETYQRRRKPLFFDSYRELFKDYPIRRVILREFPNDPGRFARSNHQKNSIFLGLDHAQSEDVILFSDLDEIFRREKVEEIVEKVQRGPHAVKMDFYCWFMNWLRGAWCFGPCAGLMKDLKVPMDWRSAAASTSKSGMPIIEEGGWHFSYMGGIPFIHQKFSMTSHTHYMTRFGDPKHIQKCFMERRDVLERDKESLKKVPVDESFPHLIREQPDRFEHWMGV